MRPSGDYRHGFLGKDDRKLVQVLSEDEALVRSLSLTDGAIARKLADLTAQARKGLGGPVVVEGRFRVQVQEARGKIACPWGHPGLYPKTHVELTNLATGERLVWTDLAVHMIEAHGFYQGQGSPYRMEPSVLKRVLDL